MEKILLCSHDPIMVKNLLGLFIDSGFMVEVVDQPFFAIKRIMEGDIDLLVIDASTFGLSITEAIGIIKNVAPEMPYIIVGSENHDMPLAEGIYIERINAFLKSVSWFDNHNKGVKNEAKGNYL